MEVKKGDIVTLAGTVETVVREKDATYVKILIDDNPHGIWINANYIKTIRPA